MELMEREEELVAKAEKLIEGAILKLYDIDPFLAFFLSEAKKIFTTEIAIEGGRVKLPYTAVTIDDEGRSYIFINPDTIQTLSSGEILGVLAHEALHLALAHPIRGSDKIEELWNIAIDLVVNAILLNKKYSLPKGGLLVSLPEWLEEFREKIISEVSQKSAEEIYFLLLEKKMKEMPSLPQLSQGMPQSGQYRQGAQSCQATQSRSGRQSKSGGAGTNERGCQQGEEQQDSQSAQDQQESGRNQSRSGRQSKSGGSSKGGSQSSQQGSGQKAPQLSQHIPKVKASDELKKYIEGINKVPRKSFDVHILREGIPPEKIEDLMEKWYTKLANAINISQTYRKGDVPVQALQLIEGLLKPKINWRSALKIFLIPNDDSDWGYNPPDYRYFGSFGFIWEDLSEPIDVKDKVVVVVIDCSGSISDEQLEQFVSELRAIKSDYPKVKVMVFTHDVEVDGPFEIEDERFNHLPITLRGGTDFRKAFKAIDEIFKESPYELAGVVWLTDGNGDYPDKAPGYPVLWVLSGSYKVEPPFGLVVEMD